uniref:Uncharacterized protein n=1 Tax=Saccharum officinarum TaxID=4547 RepID=A0A678T519_SACOF|nr:hypothetical protein SO37C23_000002 [Saccharum officinarum]
MSVGTVRQAAGAGQWHKRIRSDLDGLTSCRIPTKVIASSSTRGDAYPRRRPCTGTRASSPAPRAPCLCSRVSGGSGHCQGADTILDDVAGCFVFHSGSSTPAGAAERVHAGVRAGPSNLCAVARNPGEGGQEEALHLRSRAGASGRSRSTRADLNGLDGYYPIQTNPSWHSDTVSLWDGFRVGPG